MFRTCIHYGLLLFIVTIILLSSCKTLEKKNTETAGKIIYKNLIKDARAVDQARVYGLFKIKGIDKLPPVYLKFDSYCYFDENKVYFKISSFKTPIMDIYLKENFVYLINHTESTFIKFDIEQIDLSNIIGINFNPLEISYFFIGKVPYSPSMELMNLKWENTDLELEMTDNVSKYNILINDKEELTSAKIFNQYFDVLLLESIKYKGNSESKKTPSMLTFTDEEKTVEISFVIHKVFYQNDSWIDTPENIIASYKEVTNIEDIQININNKNQE